MDAASVLRTFAAFAKSGPDDPPHVLGYAGDMVWLSYNSRIAFEGKKFGAVVPGSHERATPENQALERIIASGQLHATERWLRVGWIWIAGTVERGGTSVSYCLPLLSLPVVRQDDTDTVRGTVGVWAKSRRLITETRVLEAAGDAEATALIGEDSLRWDLEDTADFANEIDDRAALDAERNVPVELPAMPEARAWCEQAVSSMGLSIGEWRIAGQGMPFTRAKEPGIAAFVGFGLYLHQAPPKRTKRSDLLSLASLPDIETSALASLYDHEIEREPEASDTVSLRPLSSRQRAVATRAAAAPIAAISGAPGTGKTHVLSVIALSAVARGESVLVVASSEHAVDVLLSHLADTPGPPAVTFGGSRHGARLAGELHDLLAASAEPVEHARLADYLERRQSIERLLALEAEAVRQQDDPSHRIERTAELDRAGDLNEIQELIDRMENPGPLDFSNRSERKKLERRIGVGKVEPAQTRLDELKLILDARRLLASGGLTITRPLEDLVSADDRAATDRGDVITEHWVKNLDGSRRSVVNKVAHAMTVSRAQRRRWMRTIPAGELVDAAPLWVSAAGDVDEMLPPSAGLFDLVIIDEAAQIGQADAAAALVRAKRAVVCGDPRQLNQQSSLSDEELLGATSRYGTDPAILDLRASSIYDIAARRAPVQRLEEHFRSAPHVIEFSSRRFYDGSLSVATRHPSNEAADHIHVEVVEGGSRGGSSKKVNQPEVDRCLAVAQHYIDRGCTSIGFMSPFRTQATALETAILQKYRLEEIDLYGLRVGTVHGFQGDERDVVILSWAIGPDEGASPWRFVNGPNLFNVMVTRARDQVVVVTSVPNPPGLAGDYLRWSTPLEDLVADVGSDDRWVNRVAEALREQGLPVRVGYRVGQHVIDIVVGEGDAAVAVECGPHRDGVEPHLDRAMLLQRTGWRTVDAYKSKWDSNPGQFAIELTSEFPDLRS